MVLWNAFVNESTSSFHSATLTVKCLRFFDKGFLFSSPVYEGVTTVKKDERSKQLWRGHGHWLLGTKSKLLAAHELDLWLLVNINSSGLICSEKTVTDTDTKCISEFLYPIKNCLVLKLWNFCFALPDAHDKIWLQTILNFILNNQNSIHFICNPFLVL